MIASKESHNKSGVYLYAVNKHLAFSLNTEILKLYIPVAVNFYNLIKRPRLKFRNEINKKKTQNLILCQFLAF